MLQQKMNLLKNYWIHFYVGLFVLENLHFYNISILAFGSAVLDECLLKAGLNNENCILGKTFNIEQGSFIIFWIKMWRICNRLSC
jgi:hypothetical protein